MKNKKKIIGLGISSILFFALFAVVVFNFSQNQERIQDADNQPVVVGEQQYNDNVVAENLGNQQNNISPNNEQKIAADSKSATQQSNTQNTSQITQNEQKITEDKVLPFCGPNPNEEDYDAVIECSLFTSPAFKEVNDSVYYKVDNEDNPTVLNISGQSKSGYKPINRDENNVPEWFQYNDKVKTIVIDDEITVQCAKSFFGVLNKPGQGDVASKVAEIKNLGNLNMSECEDTSFMFAGVAFNRAVKLTGEKPNWKLDQDGDYAGCLNLTNVNNVYAMFCCSNINAGFAGDIKVATSDKLTNASCMFQRAGNITKVNLSKFNMSSSSDIQADYMFNWDESLSSIEGPFSIDVSKLTSARTMFGGCTALVTLDLTNWTNNPQEGADFANMFRACPSLTTINVAAYTDWRNVNGSNMFAAQDGAVGALVGCRGTTWNQSMIDQNGAVVDLGIGIKEDGTEGTTPGYFSAKTIKAVTTSSLQASNANSATMTFYYDSVNHPETTYDVLQYFTDSDQVSWKNIRENVTNVVFDDTMSTNTGLLSTSYWFYNFNNMKNIDISKLNVDNIEQSKSMFENCSIMRNLFADTYIGDTRWSKLAGDESVDMFNNCNKLIGGNGTFYESDAKDATRAIGDFDGYLGYFTFYGNAEHNAYTLTYNYNDDSYTQSVAAGDDIYIGLNGKVKNEIFGINTEEQSLVYWIDNRGFSLIEGKTTTEIEGGGLILRPDIRLNVAQPTSPGEITYDRQNHVIDYDSAHITATGTVASVDAGDFSAQFKPNEESCWPGGSISQITINWKINQKPTDIEWTDTSFEYDKQAHVATATATDVIAGDVCGVNVSSSSANPVDVDTYTATANSLTNNNYCFKTELSNGLSTEYEIYKRTVELNWTGTEFTFNNQEQVPSCSFGRVIEGDTCVPVVSGAQKDSNAKAKLDSYTASVAFGGEYQNYKLPDVTTCSFVIDQFDLSGASVADLPITEFTYTGTLAAPTPQVSVPFLSGTVLLVAGTDFEYAYSGNQPAMSGNYDVYNNVKASGLASSNYKNTSSSKQYHETRAELSVKYHSNYGTEKTFSGDKAHWGAPYTTDVVPSDWPLQSLKGLNFWNTNKSATTGDVPGKQMANNPTSNLDLYGIWTDAYVVVNGTTIKFYCDGYNNNKTVHPGNHYTCINSYKSTPAGNLPWNDKFHDATDGSFDTSFAKCRPEGISSWFRLDPNNNYPLQRVNFANLNTSNCTDMSYLFYAAQQLNTITGFTSLDFSKVTTMFDVFCYNYGFTSIDLSSVSLPVCKEISGLFQQCKNATSIKPPNITNKCTDATTVFLNCWALTSLDLTGWDMSGITKGFQMFASANNTPMKLQKIYAKSTVDASKMSGSYEVFRKCSNLSGSISTHKCDGINNISGEFARIDTSSAIGYFTKKP